jgi:hypothetical protein
MYFLAHFECLPTLAHLSPNIGPNSGCSSRRILFTFCFFSCRHRRGGSSPAVEAGAAKRGRRGQRRPYFRPSASEGNHASLPASRAVMSVLSNPATKTAAVRAGADDWARSPHDTLGPAAQISIVAVVVVEIRDKEWKLQALSIKNLDKSVSIITAGDYNDANGKTSSCDGSKQRYWQRRCCDHL